MINAFSVLESLFPGFVGEVDLVEAEFGRLIHQLLHIKLVIGQVDINNLLKDLVASFLHLDEVDVGAWVMLCLVRYHRRGDLLVLRIHLFILFLSILLYYCNNFYFI